MGTGALRAHTQASAIELQQRTASGGHSVNAHHGRAHANAGDLGFKFTLKTARKMRDIGGSAAHVKTNDFVVPSRLRCARHPHDTAGRAAQNGIFASERMGIGQAA